MSFKFEMPSRTEAGTGVISADGDDGFVVLDDVRFDNGNGAARVWIPIVKLRLLWADELPAAPVRSASGLGRGAAVRASTFLWIGDVVLDRDGAAWFMHSDKLLRSSAFSDSLSDALTLADLIELRGPLTYYGHDNEAGE